jgi:hypothetical protein
MTLIEGKVGVQIVQDGAVSTIRQARTGEAVITPAHGAYYETAKSGSAFSVSVSGGAATAFTGGAAGTPFVSIYNPVGSGKLFSLISIGIASRVAASAAGTVTFNLWGGPSVAPTGTATVPTNLATLQAGGSSSRASSNAATTSSTAIALIRPLGAYYWATAAGALLAPMYFDIAGSVVVAPGNLVAVGGTAALTSATYDVSMVWEEITL